MAKKPRKTLQSDSVYEEFDVDGDGIVSDKELATVKAIHEAETAEEKAWDKTLSVNLKGPFFMSQHAAKMMRENGGGATVSYTHLTLPTKA